VVARLKQMLCGKPHSMRLIADDSGQVSSGPSIKSYKGYPATGMHGWIAWPLGRSGSTMAV